ncbi:DUF1998 domain-containing protein [Dolichospermum sp. ST_sed1]|nr:DUF1998 domain-containing protein [Dolichospermum sp. ST_sed1]MDD1426521.1 DUF1998 domain-containing protein [Dolichospermum sp. ST_sed9]MDD1436549.1 DUF1998 domain-containing protein [Dolichospermum sp. ST_sed10]MDD1442370.1 DUF1998 domain-containing protein [Dolichospermum sp. ST_sed3]MDD1448061.1 DUF1998 domain-containing protein [Dolichospermum sp. ST_sed8]MDD1462110.1 DUF1998 domain-containing protein [Dolichospermum sp. ST_sed2]MDD1466317.1 DUF1998 domain-containing protein [Dolichos
MPKVTAKHFIASLRKLSNNLLKRLVKKIHATIKVNNMKQTKPLAEIRQSQLLTTFGPGAMMDLPLESIIVSGLSFWKGNKYNYIREDRLKYKVQEILEVENIELLKPPLENVGDVGAFIFPKWFVQKNDETITRNGKTYRTRPLIHYRTIQQEKKRGKNVKNYVPVRFVQGCANGHLSDIDWYAFAHYESKNPHCKQQLYLDEGGSGNDFTEIFVRCQCGERRCLALAKVKNSKVLGICQGERPWLGDQGKENICWVKEIGDDSKVYPTNKPEYNRLLVRSASNIYFPQTLSVISIPDVDEEFKKTINDYYEDLQYLEDIDSVKALLFLQKRNPKYVDLIKLDAEKIWTEIQNRKSGETVKSKTIKQVEIEALLNCEQITGTEQDIFYATRRPLDNFPQLLLPYVERVVLVHRLREVIAQIGFTRFEALMPDIEGEIDNNITINVHRASLDFETTWVPAIENLGEGIFIGFHQQIIDEWAKKDKVQARGEKLIQGFKIWCERKGISADKIGDKVKFPGLPYVLLHSLSHLLITAISLECGYSASAIKERIYGNQETGYGILLYTASSGSEGTLGGLVEIGNNIEYHLKNAIKMAQICSNDPVCSQHKPNNGQEERFLHGAACHGCLLIAETSCEKGNDFLDRALLVSTLEDIGAEFFQE